MAVLEEEEEPGGAILPSQVSSRFYSLSAFCYAKIDEILATHDKLFWPRLYIVMLCKIQFIIFSCLWLIQSHNNFGVANETTFELGNLSKNPGA